VSEQVVIAGRFNGPPDTANGGYACGVVARFIDGSAEISLLRPPPLDRPLDVERAGARVKLLQGGSVVVEGEPVELDLEPPAPVTYEEAQRASRAFEFFEDHPFPTCFVCGPARAAPDGLRIFPGKLDGRDVVASPWVAHAAHADADGVVQPEVVWGALDCPTSFGAGLAGQAGPSVIVRLAASLKRPIASGERCVVIGWPLWHEGRKWEGGSAIFGADGALHAVARGLWVELKRPLEAR
jgi:hypothetical protein